MCLPIGRFDDLHGRKLEGDFRLTGEEGWFQVVDLDVNILFNFLVIGRGSVIDIKVGVLV
jgi:hypothetical protein